MKRINLILIFSISATVLFAQKPSKKMIKEMVETISVTIKTNYVLQEKGESIVEYFENDYKKGRFNQAQSLKQLDSIMCKSLYEVSNDHHLYVWNNYEVVKSLKVTSEDEGETESTNFFNNKQAYDSNFGFEKVEVLSGNIGYIKLSQINVSEKSLKKLYSAMNLVNHTKALIIDLRNNGGGGSTVGSVLESYFFDQHTELLEFKSRTGETKIETTVGWLLEEKYLKPLYILVNKGTASAAEAFAFSLKNQNRCKIVGQPTSGGAYMNTYFPVNEHFIIAVSTSAPFVPGTTVSWEGVGVQPDYMVGEEVALSECIELINKEVK